MSMTPMLKKFKTGFNRLFGSKNDGQLEFKCRNVKVKGYEYLFVRAVVPDIPEILDIERAVYKGRLLGILKTSKLRSGAGKNAVSGGPPQR